MNKKYQNKLSIINIDEEGRFGGHEKRIVQVASELKKYNIETIVIIPNKDSKIFSDFIKNHDVKFEKLNITRLSKHWLTLVRYIIRFPLELTILTLYLKRNNADIVHLNGCYQFKSVLASIFARKKIIWHLNDTNTYYFLKKIFFLLSYFVDGFIVAGERVRKYYLNNIDLRDRPIQEIHAPVDVNKFTASSNLCNERITITTLSGLNPTKGVENFIHLCSRLSKKNYDINYKIAGAILDSQKNYVTKIKKLILEDESLSERIKLLGFVDDVPDLLDKSDICVFTSLYEASPTSIWEAMAAGKAIVTTDVGSVNDYIKDGESGFIVAANDHDQLLERTEKLINDNALRVKLGNNAREVAHKRLDISSAASKHASIYRKVSN